MLDDTFHAHGTAGGCWSRGSDEFSFWLAHSGTPSISLAACALATTRISRHITGEAVELHQAVTMSGLLDVLATLPPRRFAFTNIHTPPQPAGPTP